MKKKVLNSLNSYGSYTEGNEKYFLKYTVYLL